MCSQNTPWLTSIDTDGTDDTNATLGTDDTHVNDDTSATDDSYVTDDTCSITYTMTYKTVVL